MSFYSLSSDRTSWCFRIRGNSSGCHPGKPLFVRDAPVTHQEEEWFQAPTILCQRVLHLRWHLAVHLPVDYAVFLQLAQLQGQHPLSDLWDQPLEFTEPYGP